MTDEEERQLKEYELSQQSAEHHDAMLWEVTAIIWGANTLMIAFTFETARDPVTQSRVLVAAILGIALTIFARVNYLTSRQVRRRKYAICQAIEEAIPLVHEQHVNEERVYQKGVQTNWHLAMTVLFVCGWAILGGITVWLMIAGS